jgi:sugar-specific transcriptional regulator TrmB
MDFHDSDIQTFQSLGLNSSEARVLVALYKLGTTEASRIAKTSEVNRPDVYRALANLYKLGLIEKIISHPSKFRAVPIETGMPILLEYKTKEFIELKVKSTSLIRRMNEKRGNEEPNQESQFILIPFRDALFKRLTKSIKNAQKSIDVATSWKRFNSICYRLAESLDEAWNKGVKGRAVIEETGEAVVEFAKNYWRPPNAEVRQIQSFPRTVMALYDKKEVYIYLLTSAEIIDSPSLWSNNPNIVAMAEDYFETLWKAAPKGSVI